MIYKKKILLISVFYCFYSVAFAQNNAVIHGIVVDSAGVCVESATVSLLKLPDSVLVMKFKTDKDGSFRFYRVPPGKYRIVSVCVGHNKSVSVPFDVTPGGAHSLRLILPVVSSLLSEVEISGSAAFIDRSPGKTILNVDKNIASAGSSAFDILRRAPGITINQEGGITMKGKQGVTVMIDGKTVSLSSNDLAELLKNTSADAVDKIELISNPSSGYDAGGAGGVVNIKLKKNKSIGTNGNVSVGSGYGENYKFNSSVVFNHRRDFCNLYVTWAYGNNKRTDRYDLDRSVSFRDVRTIFDIANHDVKSFVNHNFKAGSDFYISKKQTIGLMFTGTYSKMHSVEDNNTFISHIPQSPDSLVSTYSDERRSISNSAFNLNYKSEFGKASSLNIDLDYLTYHRKSDEALSYDFYNEHNELYCQSSGLVNHTPSDITIQSAKADYSTSPGAGSLFQCGLKTSFVSNNSRRSTDNIDEALWLKQSFIADESDFKEYIHAVYGSFSKEYKNKARLEFGLRGEYTRTFTWSRSASSLKRDYFNLFPYFNFSQPAGVNHKLSLLYNRRISRPAYDDLNPFRYFLDQYTYREGNPGLRPEYSQSIELSDVYKDKLTASVSYSYEKDYYLTFSLQNDTTRISRSVKRNLESVRSVGVEINYSLVTGSWLNSNLNLQGYLRRFKSGALLPAVRNSSYMSFGSVNTIKFRKGYSAQCNFIYESPTVSGMFDFKSVYNLDLGGGKSFMNDKGMVRLSLSDVFNSDRSRYSSGLMQVAMSAREKKETRIVRLNVTYKIGSKSLNSGSSRNTGNDSERKRMSN